MRRKPVFVLRFLLVTQPGVYSFDSISVTSIHCGRWDHSLLSVELLGGFTSGSSSTVSVCLVSSSAVGLVLSGSKPIGITKSPRCTTEVFYEWKPTNCLLQSSLCLECLRTSAKLWQPFEALGWHHLVFALDVASRAIRLVLRVVWQLDFLVTYMIQALLSTASSRARAKREVWRTRHAELAWVEWVK